jgi:hypothetical protein
MVDDAMRAHKLGRRQRPWALKYAAQDPTGFAKIMKLTPDYLADRQLEMTRLVREQLAIDVDRRSGRETGSKIASLILRMRRVARQLSIDIEDGLIPPEWARDRDQLVDEAKRLSAPLSKVRVNPLTTSGRPPGHNMKRETFLAQMASAVADLRRNGLKITQVAVAGRMKPELPYDTFRDYLEPGDWPPK